MTRLTKLLEAIQSKFPVTPIVMMGDFNAKIPRSPHKNGNQIEMERSFQVPAQVLAGKQGDSKGRSLNTVLKSFNMVIRNGILTGEQLCRNTYDNGKISSLIDYAVVPINDSKLVKDFAIGDRAGSDHRPLTLKLEFNVDNKMLRDGASQNINKNNRRVVCTAKFKKEMVTRLERVQRE